MHRCAIAIVLSAAGLVAGCSSNHSDSSMKSDATMKSDASMKSDSAMKPATTPMMADKDMTHVVTDDAMYGMEMTGPMNAGMLKKDTKVVLMMPGSMAQVMTADGRKVYIDGSKLRALGK